MCRCCGQHGQCGTEQALPVGRPHSASRNKVSKIITNTFDLLSI